MIKFFLLAILIAVTANQAHGTVSCYQCTHISMSTDDSTLQTSLDLISVAYSDPSCKNVGTTTDVTTCTYGCMSVYLDGSLEIDNVEGLGDVSFSYEAFDRGCAESGTEGTNDCVTLEGDELDELLGEEAEALAEPGLTLHYNELAVCICDDADNCNNDSPTELKQNVAQLGGAGIQSLCPVLLTLLIPAWLMLI